MYVRATLVTESSALAVGWNVAWRVADSGRFVTKAEGAVDKSGGVLLLVDDMSTGGHLALGETPLAAAPASFDGKTLDYGKIVVFATPRDGFAGATAISAPVATSERLAVAQVAGTEEAVSYSDTRVLEEDKVVADAPDTSGTSSVEVSGATGVADAPTDGKGAEPSSATTTTTSRTLGDTLVSAGSQIETARASTSTVSLSTVTVRFAGTSEAEQVEATWRETTPANTGTSPAPAPAPAGAPDLLGMTPAAATRRLAQLGHKADVRTRFTTDAARHGRVVQQVPLAGQPVPTGLVTLYVARVEGT